MFRTDADLIRLHASLRKQAFEAMLTPLTTALQGEVATEKNASVRHALIVHFGQEDRRE